MAADYQRARNGRCSRRRLAATAKMSAAVRGARLNGAADEIERLLARAAGSARAA
jgi:hypothetical protein